MLKKWQSRFCNRLAVERNMAEDGQNALAKFQNKTYDLVFMDIGLPDMDGHAVTMKIREHEKGIRHAPIVALTAHANDAEKAKAMASGMDGFYAKPLTPQIAQQVLSQYVK